MEGTYPRGRSAGILLSIPLQGISFNIMDTSEARVTTARSSRDFAEENGHGDMWLARVYAPLNSGTIAFTQRD